MNKNRFLIAACAVAFAVNLALFMVKLYIGLRTNSISIYSDAVNNLFDSLSGLITLIFMTAILKKAGETGVSIPKCENLFSFLTALAMTGVGLYFAYTALERLMYPTPVWFTYYYLAALIITCAVKIALLFIYSRLGKKSESPVIKVMKYDCILDFFITMMTVITLIVSKTGTYAVDSVFGIIISIIMTVTAVKLVISNGKELVDYKKVN